MNLIVNGCTATTKCWISSHNLLILSSMIAVFWIPVCHGSSNKVDDWNLPVLSSHLPTVRNENSGDKLIPKNLWMASKNTTLSKHTVDLMERNPGWKIHVGSDEVMNEFMNKQFAGTSYLWAFHMINPLIGAAKADLWRYAVLWTYGGVYIDDDSDITRPFDEMINPEDTFIAGYENNGFNGNRCYIPTYKLSDFKTFKNKESLRDLHIFNDRILLNWALVSAPRHPILAQTMVNAVEIIKQEYLQEPVIRSLGYEHRWKSIMCSTGPSVLTASAREVLFHANETSQPQTNNSSGIGGEGVKPSEKIQYRLGGLDFRDYGGSFKVDWTKTIKSNKNHYMHIMQKNKNVKLLREYLPEKPVSPEKLAEWQGQAIQGQNGKEIFVLDKGKKRSLPNYDTFIALNFTMADVIVVSDMKMNNIEKGAPMPSLMV